MTSTKLIREGRFGPPKTFKTGAIVGTYPRPMLVLELDSGGLDIIPSTPFTGGDKIKIEVTAKDITTIKFSELATYCSKKPEELPPITCLDLASHAPREISLNYDAPVDTETFISTINSCNQVIKKCPWKTVVLDNTTTLSDAIYNHLAATNKGLLADARKWAPTVGNKIKAVLAEMCNLNAHFVVIMHEDTEKDELTGIIKTEPMIFSKYRQLVGGFLSQFFYQKLVNGVPKIITADNGFIKGLGARWPELHKENGVTFKEIYGKEFGLI